MPARQPFTALCGQIASVRPESRVDLHLHTTFSDGTYSPAEITDLARRSGMPAFAITDHDTLEGVPVAQAAATAFRIEVIAGVEITAEFRGREIHLLAYFVDVGNQALQSSLAQLRASRRERFLGMIDRLRTMGIALDADDAPTGADPSLGRRHLAEMMVRAKKVASVQDAFRRYLGDESRFSVPKKRLPIEEALTLVRDAGGVASWAHPSYDCTKESLTGLASQGLGAVEAYYPTTRYGRQRELRTWARQLDLAVTGGSDCHGPDHLRRAVGAAGVSWRELEELRDRAGSKPRAFLMQA